MEQFFEFINRMGFIYAEDYKRSDSFEEVNKLLNGSHIYSSQEEYEKDWDKLESLIKPI